MKGNKFEKITISIREYDLHPPYLKSVRKGLLFFVFPLIDGYGYGTCNPNGARVWTLSVCKYLMTHIQWTTKIIPERDAGSITIYWTEQTRKRY